MDHLLLSPEVLDLYVHRFFPRLLSVPVELLASSKAYIYPIIPRTEFLLAFLILYASLFLSYCSTRLEVFLLT